MVKELYALVMGLILNQNKKIIFPVYPLSNIEIKKYYQNEPRFINVYSFDNLHNKIRDGAYIINLDEYSDIGTHWGALYGQNNDVTYFDSFGVEHIPEKIRTFIGNKNIKTSADIFVNQFTNHVSSNKKL